MIWRRGHLHALGASVLGWQCHISHLSHSYLGSAAENPLAKHHAGWENTYYIRNLKAHFILVQEQQATEQYLYYDAYFVFENICNTRPRVPTDTHTHTPRGICNTMLTMVVGRTQLCKQENKHMDPPRI